MGIAGWLRRVLSGMRLPLWAGRIIAAVPYHHRPGLGLMYKKSFRSLREMEVMDTRQKEEWVFQKMRDLVIYAENNIPFYSDHYHRNGFDSTSLKTFEDIQRIPPVTKSQLLKYELQNRSNLDQPGYLVNTGGTSGTTLDLYIHPDHMGNEWSHMHHIWSKRGFHPTDLKLMFTGRSEFKRGIHYDFVRHSLSINIYAGIDQIAPQLRKLVQRYHPKYIHGYPSAIYEFALSCRESYPDLLEILRNSLLAGFLGSEYPIRRFRETIEDLFQISTISWYGHTERCILAYEEKDPLIYHPFQTYGFTEVVTNDSGEETLVGSSYYNLTSPLIRYDTEDQVSDYEMEGGLLARFRVKEGRVGEFILDGNGKKIPLTGLIFGRHHELFNYCSHIQIHQKEPGFATVLYVPLKARDISNPKDLFDSKNVNIIFDFLELPEPIRTAAGKVKLIVKDDMIHQKTSEQL